MSWIDESVERTGALKVPNRAAHADARWHRVLQVITGRLGQTVRVYQTAPRPDAKLGSDNLNGDGEYSVTIKPQDHEND